MPYAKHFQRVLAKKRNPFEAGLLVKQAKNRYQALLEKSPHLAQPALKIHLKNSILPGLALYQTLIEEGNPQEEVLAEMAFALEKTVDSSLKFIKLLEHLPKQFLIFRKVLTLFMKTSFPIEGWDMTWKKNNDHEVAFNIHSCFYLQALEHYGIPELVSV